MGLVFGTIVGVFISQCMRTFRQMMLFSKWVQLLQCLFTMGFCYSSHERWNVFLFFLNLAWTNNSLFPQHMTEVMLCKFWAQVPRSFAVFHSLCLRTLHTLRLPLESSQPPGGWEPHGRDSKTARQLPLLSVRSVRKPHCLPAQPPCSCNTKAKNSKASQEHQQICWMLRSYKSFPC